MQKRPLSISIIAWWLIISAVISIFSVFAMRGNPMVERIYAHSPIPMSVHIAFAVIGVLVIGACGYGMLKGLNWSRFVYVGWSLLGFVVSFLAIPIASILVFGIVLFAVIVFFLFRPAANEWFSRGAPASA